MPDLYLFWRGVSSQDTLCYGTRCATMPIVFEQPQVPLYEHGAGDLIGSSGFSAAALPDRILVIGARQFNEIGVTDDSIHTAYCQSWPNWVTIGDGTLPGTASTSTPTVAPFATGALAIWTGIGSDTRLWTSQYNRAENVWSSQYLTQLSGTGKPIQAGAGPALLNFNGLLLLVWRGEGSNTQLYYATSRDGRTWTGNKGIPRAGTLWEPALTVFNGNPVLCFRGSADDTIYSTTYHVSSDSWAPVVNTGAFGTAQAPTLAVFQGKLFMAWRGAGDTGLYWSTTTDNLNPSAWARQTNIPNVGSLAGPAAVVVVY